MKISSGQNVRKGFFTFFCKFMNSLGSTGVFSKVWEAEKGDWGEEFGEDGKVGASVGCGVLRGKNVHKNDFEFPDVVGLKGLNCEEGVIDGAEAVRGDDDDGTLASFNEIEGGVVVRTLNSEF